MAICSFQNGLAQRPLLVLMNWRIPGWRVQHQGSAFPSLELCEAADWTLFSCLLLKQKDSPVPVSHGKNNGPTVGLPDKMMSH